MLLQMVIKDGFKNKTNTTTMHKPGDIITLEGTGCFADGIRCIIVSVDPETGNITKMKAETADERLAKKGFIIEGDDWVVLEWHWSCN